MLLNYKSFADCLNVLFVHLSNRNKFYVRLLFPFLFFSVTVELLSSFLLIPLLTFVLSPQSGNTSTFSKFVAYIFDAFQLDLSAFNLLIFVVLVAIISSIIRIFVQSFREFTIKSVVIDLSSKAYSNLLCQPYLWHLSHDSHKLSVRLDSIDAINSNILNSIINIFISVSLLLCSFSVALYTSWQITILACIFLLFIYLCLSNFVRHRLSRNSLVRVTARQKMTSIRYDSFAFMAELIIYNMSNYFSRQYHVYDSRLRNCQFEIGIISSIPKIVIELFAILFIASFSYSVFLVGTSEDAFSLIIVFAIAFQKCLPQFNSAFSSFAAIKSNSKFLLDYNKLLTLPRYPANTSNTVRLLQSGIIIISNLQFSYQGSSVHGSNLYNLNIQVGKLTSLSVASGTGKTTLLNLLMGLLEPSDGSILYQPDHTRKTTILNSEILKNICTLVPQDVFLFNDTLDNNILAFDSNIDPTILKLVKKIAAIDEKFLSGDLSLHSTTPLGDRGSLLSGGQKQRIGLARALYSSLINNKSILFLDEAFNGINIELETEIISNIRTYCTDLTLISVTHNQSTLNLYDYNLFL